MAAISYVRYGLRVATAMLIDILLTEGASSMHMNFAASGFVHLLFVVVVALKLGFWPATAASVAANLGMNFYLIAPMSSFRVADPQNLIALVVFEICALIVSELSAQSQRHGTLAETHRKELEKICSFSRRLLLLNRSEKPSIQILKLVADEFETEAALFLDGEGNGVQVACDQADYGTKLTEMEGAVRAAYGQNQDSGDRDDGLFVRVMRLGSTPIGAVGLKGPRMTVFLSTAISLLCAISLEREKALERESQQAAEQKGEQLRVAVLDGLAHEYKTPLTVIRTAAGGLLEMGDLGPFQSEMVELIDNQTSRLDAITSELLRSSRLFGDETQVKPEAIDAQELVSGLLCKMNGTLVEREVKIITAEGEHLVADRGLVITALTQYLDNAAKYSPAGSPITVSVKGSAEKATISVHNVGSYIPHGERERIFDRFHRVTATTQGIAGTGIGLSIVRKIAAAHEGQAWVTSDRESGTTFWLSLRMGTKV